MMMNKKNKPGRPYSGKSLRDKHTAVYITDHQAARYNAIAKQMGLRSGASLCAAVMEHLLLNSFSRIAFLDLHTYIHDSTHAETISYHPELFEPEPILPISAAPTTDAANNAKNKSEY